MNTVASSISTKAFALDFPYPHDYKKQACRVANSRKHRKHACGTKILKLRNQLGKIHTHKCREIETVLPKLHQLNNSLNDAGKGKLSIINHTY